MSFPSSIIVCLSESGSKSGLFIIKGNSKDSEPTNGKEQNKQGVFLSKIILLSLSNSIAQHILIFLSLLNFFVNSSLYSFIFKYKNVLIELLFPSF